MGFDAADAVPALDWDFTKYCGPDAKGCSPEPSGTAIWTFQQNYMNTLQAARRTALAKAAIADETTKDKSEAEMKAEVERWAAMTWDEAIELAEKTDEEMLGKDAAQDLSQRVANLIAGVTENCPSADQIMRLPGRVRTAYVGWFVGQLTSPEA